MALQDKSYHMRTKPQSLQKCRESDGKGQLSEYLGRLEQVCNEKSLELEVIGYAGGDKRYPITGIEIAGSKTKDMGSGHSAPAKTIVFASGMHGEEPGGPCGVLRFLERYSPKSTPGLNILLLPLTNPYGFERGYRWDRRRYDMNRHFNESPLQNDNAIVHGFATRRGRPYFFHSIHEDVDAKCFYMYNYTPEGERLCKKMIKYAEKSVPISLKKTIEKEPATDGVIRKYPLKDDNLVWYALKKYGISDQEIRKAKHSHSLLTKDKGEWEILMQKQGVPYVILTETPAKQPLEKRATLIADMMEQIVGFCAKIA